MEILSVTLKRLVVLCVMISVSEMLLPSGPLKSCVRLVSGLCIAGAMLQMILSVPAALTI